MTPVERLQAAIKKLELERAESFGQGAHPWWVEKQEANPAFEAEVRARGVPDGFHDGIAMVQDCTDATLIVTLHRTIDAQLEILREAYRYYRIFGVEAIPITKHGLNAVALADAILGTAALAEEVHDG